MQKPGGWGGGTEPFPSSSGCVITGRQRNWAVQMEICTSQFFPCAWYWGVGKKGRAVRWSGCPTSKQQAIPSTWVMHIFFFLSFVLDCGNETHPSKQHHTPISTLSPSGQTNYRECLPQAHFSFPLAPWASFVVQPVKNLPAMQETQVWPLGQKDSPGEGNGCPLQYSCLENSTDRGAWWATVHGVKSQR